MHPINDVARPAKKGDLVLHGLESTGMFDYNVPSYYLTIPVNNKAITVRRELLIGKVGEPISKDIKTASPEVLTAWINRSIQRQGVKQGVAPKYFYTIQAACGDKSVVWDDYKAYSDEEKKAIRTCTDYESNPTVDYYESVRMKPMCSSVLTVTLAKESFENFRKGLFARMRASASKKKKNKLNQREKLFVW